MATYDREKIDRFTCFQTLIVSITLQIDLSVKIQSIISIQRVAFGKDLIIHLHNSYFVWNSLPRNYEKSSWKSSITIHTVYHLLLCIDDSGECS